MARFTLMLVALIAITGFLLALVFKTSADHKALLVSAVIAAVVQLAGFVIIQVMGKERLLVAWGMGAILRFTFLVLSGVFLAQALGLPLTAALVSFAVFLFLSMLLETFVISNASR
jgi:hypothetical protein